MNVKKLIKLLTSMRASIVLLITLGIIASIGTIIPQGYSNDAIVDQYGNYIGQLILVLGLDHLYHTWFFLGLGIVLFLQLLICTFRRMKKVRSVNQFGSILIHVSFMVVLCGAFISLVAGSHQVIEGSIGETIDLSEGGLAGSSITINDFTIDYYDQGIASQYNCDLTYTDKSGNATEKVVTVNHPYSHNGVKIYQQSYGWESDITLKLGSIDKSMVVRDGKDIILDNGGTLQTFFLPDYDEQSKSLKSKSNEPNNPVLVAGFINADGSVSDMVLLHPGETRQLSGGSISFENYGLFTVLNVKHDRSIIVIFAGFIIATIGLFLRYMPIKKKKEDADGNA